MAWRRVSDGTHGTPVSRGMGWFCFLVLVAGCGGRETPDLGYVTGVVKLDGAPVSDALVQFIPKEGRLSSGRTGPDGKYELEYLDGIKGAKIGQHIVKVSTAQSADEEAGKPAVPEKIPSMFNNSSKVTKEVKSGSNEINIDLDSKARPSK
jgi:hypothetical protein